MRRDTQAALVVIGAAVAMVLLVLSPVLVAMCCLGGVR